VTFILALTQGTAKTFHFYGGYLLRQDKVLDAIDINYWV